MSRDRQVIGRHEARLRAVLDTVSDGIIAIDGKGTIQSVNPATERLFGYAADEMLGQNVNMLMPEPWAGEHDAYLRRYLDTGEARIIGIGREVAGKRKDGTTFPLELAVSETRVDDVRYFVGVVRDVSERVRAEAELLRTRARLDRAIAGTSDGLWDWDVVKGTVWYAPRFKELLGYRGDEFPHMLDSFASHLHPEDADATWAAVNAHLEEQAPYDVEYRLRTKPGNYCWFQARGQAVWDDAGKPVLMSGSIMDISRRKEAERALLEAKEQAEESNRLKSEFLNMMSHELRTPLTVVLGYLPLLKNAATMPAPEAIAGMATDMRQAGDHLLHLINDLLDLSKIEAGKMELRLEEVDMSRIVDGVLSDMRREAEAKGLSFVSGVEETIVRGDRVRLRQILINLVGNAIKFTDRGTISVTSRPLDGGVELEVKDTGIGIPEKDLTAIFDRFRQVDSSSTRKAGGTGLGLTITKKLVDLHGGTIDVKSLPGEGSTFTFSILEGEVDRGVNI